MELEENAKGVTLRVHSDEDILLPGSAIAHLWIRLSFFASARSSIFPGDAKRHEAAGTPEKGSKAETEKMGWEHLQEGDDCDKGEIIFFFLAALPGFLFPGGVLTTRPPTPPPRDSPTGLLMKRWEDEEFPCELVSVFYCGRENEGRARDMEHVNLFTELFSA